jgi:hypothetical protein
MPATLSLPLPSAHYGIILGFRSVCTRHSCVSMINDDFRANLRSRFPTCVPARLLYLGFIPPEEKPLAGFPDRRQVLRPPNLSFIGAHAPHQSPWSQASNDSCRCRHGYLSGDPGRHRMCYVHCRDIDQHPNFRAIIFPSRNVRRAAESNQRHADANALTSTLSEQ